jgi:hypothetical protein
MEKKRSNSSKQPARAHPTLLSDTFNLLLMLMVLSVLAWLLLLGWFSIKIIFSNNYDSNFYIQEILDSQFNYINYYNPYVISIITLIFKKIQHLIQPLLDYAGASMMSKNLIHILCGTLEIILTRMCIFLLSIPFLIVIFGVFIIDGLVQRDIRKFQGERESALFFHRAKLLSSTLFGFIFFLFLAMPIQISSQYILIPMSLICGFILMYSIKNFKKYM